MKRTVINFAACVSGLIAVMVVTLWIHSYFASDDLRHFPPESHGYPALNAAAAQVDSPWLRPCTEYATFRGHLIIEHPWVSNTQPGWQFASNPLRQPEPRLPVNWLGFHSQQYWTVIPIWPAAFGFAVMPTFFIVNQFRSNRRKAGFEMIRDV